MLSKADNSFISLLNDFLSKLLTVGYISILCRRTLVDQELSERIFIHHSKWLENSIRQRYIRKRRGLPDHSEQ